MGDALAYHVEVRRSFRRAWAFNLSAERLRASVLAPWLANRALELGDREWQPRESQLRILEGPELSPTDLAFGQGWNNAERSGRIVTRRILAAVAEPAVRSVAVIAETAAARAAAADALAAVGAEPTPFEEPDGWRAAGAGGYAAAVIAVDGAPSRRWLFEAGLAIGAFGRRAVVVELGAGSAPAELRGFEPVRLDPADPATVAALQGRLRSAAGERPAPTKRRAAA